MKLLAGCSMALHASLLFAAGCAARTIDADPAGADPEARSTRSAAPPPAPGSISEQSIYTIREPGSRVAPGMRVHLGGPAIKVTATTASTIWIQEAADEGGCEMGDAIVAYRAITVRTSGPAPALVAGQRVDVEGTVVESGRRRWIDDATVTPGAIGEPYQAHCERDANALASRALDDVLVLTAGTTEATDPPAADGSWSLVTCFGDGARTITVGASMTEHRAWAPGWHWVRGVLGGEPGARRLDPREPSDILDRAGTGQGSDACL